MIARFLFELVPNEVPKIDSIDLLILFVICAFFCIVAVSIFLFTLFFCVKKFKLSEDFENNCIIITAFISILLAISPPFYLTLHADFLKARYMAEYANGNYKYSKIMKYCITQNKANYLDVDDNPIKNDTVRGMILCYQWERYAFNKQEKKAKEAARIEQIRKEVR